MEQDRAEWAEWHDKRVADLATPFGWLSLTGLIWMKEGVQRTLREFPGAFVLDGTWLHFDPGASSAVGPTASALDAMSAGSYPRAERVQVTHDKASGRFSVWLPLGASLLWLTDGKVVVEAINRDGRLGLRVRDSRAPLLGTFIDVPAYEHDRSFIVPATFTRLPQPQHRRIVTAAPGLEVDEFITGTIEFELGGRAHRLLTSGDPGSGMHVNFHDATNGATTSQWRRLDIGIPDPSGLMVIDFNRAINYPMAFTPFATCPAPVEENSLDVAITAGETKPRQTLSETGLRTPILIVETSGRLFYGRTLKHMEQMGLQVDFARLHEGDPLPDLIGYQGLIVFGFESAGGGPLSASRADLLEFLDDAMSSHIPTVAVGDACRLLEESAGVKVDANDLPVPQSLVQSVESVEISLSEDVAQDVRFRSLVTSPTAPLSRLRASRDGDDAALIRSWNDLVDRFSRLVHAEGA